MKKTFSMILAITYLLGSQYAWADCTGLDIRLKGKLFSCKAVTLEGTALTFFDEEDARIEISMTDESAQPFSNFEYDTKDADNNWQDVPHLRLHFKEGRAFITENHSNNFELQIRINEASPAQHKVAITMNFPEGGGTSVSGEFITDNKRSQETVLEVSAELENELCVLAREEKKALLQCEDVSCLDEVFKNYSSIERQRVVLNLPSSSKAGMLDSLKTLGEYFTAEGIAKSGCEAVWLDDKLEIYPFYKTMDGGVPSTRFVNENGSWKVSL
jgi:hypothetical protein